MKEEYSHLDINDQIKSLRELLNKEAEEVLLTDSQLEEVSRFINFTKKKAEEVRRAREEQTEREKQLAKVAERAEAERKREAEKERRAEEEKARVAEESYQDIEEERFLLDSRNGSTEDPTAIEMEKLNIANNEQLDLSQNESLPVVSNETSVDFVSFIQENGAYLMLQKQKWPQRLHHDLKNEGVRYPLGVAYDEKAKRWLICDRNTEKILLIDVKMESMNVCDDISCPTAIIVYEEGKSAAVLCAVGKSHTIYIYHHSEPNPFIQAFARHDEPMYDMRHQLRGLAKSVGGNILSLEKHNQNRMRVFNKGMGGKGFSMAGTNTPCFIASFRSTVAVSDLGVNKVFICNLDDRDWESISFQMLRVIETTVVLPPDQLANQSGFQFVAGMQFDCNGFLLIGDAKGHSIKLYDTDYNFLHRVSSDFVLPYVSSFHVNKDGDCILLDVKQRDAIQWVKMSSVPNVRHWVAPTTQCPSSSRQDFQQRPRRGGFQSRRF
ncbi:hypothetical protein L3Y34_015041 [Caenorhabditis briggsae]|uniref:Uncharacterized protein n=1 Tax=Caenorhabditis briggsae TaxID=6238 RepID=A0AAE9DUW6_CAEBR|nr:hypothetical protein L3Y34_015041 [Caenorhabditis briggsae]